MKLLLITCSIFFVNVAISADLDEVIKQKDLGNRCYQCKNYGGAIAHYSEALKHEGVDTTTKIHLHRNQGMAFLKLGNFNMANENFFQAFMIDKNDPKTLHWLIETKLGQKKLLEAFYYASLRAYLNRNGDNENKVKAILQQYYEIIEKLRVDQVSINMVHAIINNYVSFLEEVGVVADPLSFMNKLQEHALTCSPFLHEVEQSWKKNECVPLPRQEYPQLLASFIGENKAIVTPCVQGLPFYLAQKNNRVYVADVEQKQLSYMRHWRKAIKENKLKTFKKEALTKFIAQISDQSVIVKSRQEFDNLYDPLDGFNDDEKISSHHGDIFSYVDSLIKNNQAVDAVFLSTILHFQKHELPKRYLTILKWLCRNISVTMTVLRDSFLSMEFARLMILSFSDVADVEYKLFDESPTVFHVKITPKAGSF